MFAQKYGPWALIAAAPEGVGACFARQLAARGLNLALIARKPQPLEEVAGAAVSEPDEAAQGGWIVGARNREWAKALVRMDRKAAGEELSNYSN